MTDGCHKKTLSDATGSAKLKRLATHQSWTSKIKADAHKQDGCSLAVMSRNLKTSRHKWTAQSNGKPIANTMWVWTTSLSAIVASSNCLFLLR
jgi:hypothetical protein